MPSVVKTTPVISLGELTTIGGEIVKLTHSQARLGRFVITGGL